MEIFLVAVAAYILGSIPFGKLFCLMGGVDIQTRGSGNIGYANVQRIMGWRYGIPTLTGDILKGAAATLIGLQLGGPALAFWLGMIALLGHVFPVWLKFRGGKGIATGLGMIAVLAPFVALASAITYTLLLRAGRSSSIASLIGVAIVAVGLPIALPGYWWMSFICITVPLFTLRANLRGTVPDYG